MKKMYIICAIILVLGITSGISFFVIRDANAQIPDDITLVTMNNEKFTFGKADKKLKLVEFIYTHCPDVCPTTTQRMNMLRNDLQDEGVFGKKIQFLTVTIDPYRDTPEALKKHMDALGIEDDGNWLMLTGDSNIIKEEQKKIRELADTFQFQYRDPGNGLFIHSSFTFLIDENNEFIEKFPMGEDFNRQEVFDVIMDEI
ncbi:SCO family protein [Bacillus canaveralius]|uniref:SCO family protein n=1 Tax=Bacillus canaveralius TaxID=1403243 RepID=A0A2N5GIL5_9BACI|nr:MULTISPECIES: SCO family protein [Bacillus]PLR80816.1 SCO family protein [Bacillus canaveralius]PLR81924.1 SCO family protein [Bacillus sp. V33-4]PLR98307.1 SCO family protein [Bacillus canaveralius]RSK52972.1 SCO family protein [Bacillus canaveralius]